MANVVVAHVSVSANAKVYRKLVMFCPRVASCTCRRDANFCTHASANLSALPFKSTPSLARQPASTPTAPDRLTVVARESTVSALLDAPYCLSNDPGALVERGGASLGAVGLPAFCRVMRRSSAYLTIP